MAHYIKICTVFILFSVVSNVNAATVKNMLHCFGKEELFIHKAKNDGPIYFLNQLFINELSSFNDVEVKQKYLDAICNQREFAPSLALLHHMLLYGKDLYQIRILSGEEGLWAYKNSQLEDMVNRGPHIFFLYLAHLQKLLPTHDCLSQEIPEITYFMERYYYLESDFPTDKLMKDKSRVEAMFEKLKNLDRIIKKCEASAKKRYEEKHR